MVLTIFWVQDSEEEVTRNFKKFSVQSSDIACILSEKVCYIYTKSILVKQ
jgi:hypothetical protein